MAIYPKAVLKLIPPGPNDPRIKPRMGVLHVAVSEQSSLYKQFIGPSGIESHFYIRRDGVVEQYRDTDWQADANFKANDFAISIETQGMGEGEWTRAQLVSIKEIINWCFLTHGIPFVKPERWDGTGWGYHTQFDEWHPVAKSCPGPDRIVQYNNIIVPWLKVRNTPVTRPSRMPPSWHKFEHYPAPFCDSLAGLRLAKQEGYERADVNMLMTKDFVLVAAHWDRPLMHGWYDPLNKTGRFRTVSSMTLAHLQRLKHKKYPNMRIKTMWAMLDEASKLDLTLEIDVKKDKRFTSKTRWVRFAEVVKKFNVDVMIKIESTIPHAAEILGAAHDSDFTTAVLPRGTKRLKKAQWWPVADYVRGPVKWV